jgi:hypothetical protein
MCAVQGPKTATQHEPSRCQTDTVADVVAYVDASTVMSCVAWPVEANWSARLELQAGAVVGVTAVAGATVVGTPLVGVDGSVVAACAVLVLGAARRAGDEDPQAANGTPRPSTKSPWRNGFRVMGLSRYFLTRQ